MSTNKVTTRARQIFESVLNETGLPDQDRLESLCRGNTDLLMEVRSLVAAFHAADSILESPFGSSSIIPVSDSQDIRAGHRFTLGDCRYRLTRLIGSGGFGRVFEAEQESPVQRLVAVKVLKTGSDLERQRQRFENERQTLSIFNHPNIARLLDVGSGEGGQQFFVMELVSGKNIASYCDENGKGIRERIDLFLAVCEAVEYAHRKGVIHRDLKPSNILVEENEEDGVAKVIDFGIARVVDECSGEWGCEWTSDSLFGTPLFMSPEQARGDVDIDTRADVYSLGGILYRLLTGRPAIDLGTNEDPGFTGFRERIQNEVPVSLRECASDHLDDDSAERRFSTNLPVLRRTLRDDLNRVVMKALEKDREKRYVSAIALSDDLKRWMNREAVHAGSSTVLYRTGKFVRKNLIASLVSLGFVVTLASAAIFSTMMWRTAENAIQRQREVLGVLVETVRNSSTISERAGTIRNLEEYFEKQPDAKVDHYESGIEAVFGDERFRVGKYAGCVEHYRLARKACEETGEDSDIPYLITCARLSLALVVSGEKDEGNQLAEETLAKIASTGEEFSYLTAVCQVAQAKYAFEYGRFEDAIAMVERAIDSVPVDGYAEVATLVERAMFKKVSDKKANVEFLQDAYNKLKSDRATGAGGEESWLLLLARQQLALRQIEFNTQANGSVRQSGPMEDLLERNIDVLHEKGLENHPMITKALFYLSLATIDGKDMRDADRYLELARNQVANFATDPDHFRYLEHFSIVRNLQLKTEWQRLIPIVGRTIRLATWTFGPESAEVGRHRCVLIHALVMLNRFKEAEAQFRMLTEDQKKGNLELKYNRIRWMFAMGREQKVHEDLEETMKSLEQNDNIPESLRLRYLSVLKLWKAEHLIQSGETSDTDTETLIQEIKDGLGIKPSQFYTILIDALIENRCYKEADDLVAHLSSSKFELWPLTRKTLRLCFEMLTGKEASAAALDAFNDEIEFAIEEIETIERNNPHNYKIYLAPAKRNKQLIAKCMVALWSERDEEYAGLWRDRIDNRDFWITPTPESQTDPVPSAIEAGNESG